VLTIAGVSDLLFGRNIFLLLNYTMTFDRERLDDEGFDMATLVINILPLGCPERYEGMRIVFRKN
jgi:hypothetical protein